ncbi:MAG: class I SAM-dependent methyltransferase [Candidatus Heimdallarchaeota archaeon]|nr:MAG: class I SAM-dependent methyltransferase [Candidatus Heimdallarchaeota archaeon]
MPIASSADWEAYAKSTSSALIRAHYFFTVWRNYRILLHGLKIPQGSLLEIGSSTGLNSLRLSKKYNLKPTLVDTSKFALALAYRLYSRSYIIPKLIQKDVLELSLNQQFDFVHSHGLLEHFKHSAQLVAFQNHAKHVRPGGWLICWVPTPDILYRLSRWYLERTGQWIFGYEKPLHLRDFISFFRQNTFQIKRIRHPPGWIGIAAKKML